MQLLSLWFLREGNKRGSSVLVLAFCLEQFPDPGVRQGNPNSTLRYCWVAWDINQGLGRSWWLECSRAVGQRGCKKNPTCPGVHLTPKYWVGGNSMRTGNEQLLGKQVRQDQKSSEFPWRRVNKKTPLNMWDVQKRIHKAHTLVVELNYA